MTDDPWLQFMQMQSPAQGLSLQEILGWDVQSMEDDEAFISWLFPLPEGCEIAPDAPVLTAMHFEAIKASPKLRKQIGINLDRVLRHWGIERQATRFLKGDNYEEQSGLWLCSLDHNHLRIERVLAFLALTGFQLLAHELFKFLNARMQDELLGKIGSVKDWAKALQRKGLGC
jgi:hypothetical protein